MAKYKMWEECVSMATLKRRAQHTSIYQQVKKLRTICRNGINVSGVQK